MSTLDPGIEPPGDWQPRYEPPSHGPSEATYRAAVYVWLCAGLSLALSGCCGLGAIGMSMLPTSEIMSQVPSDMPNRDQLRQMLPFLAVAIGIVSVIFFLIPGVVLAILGFPVRSGSRPAAISAMIVLGIQAAVMGLMVLIYLIGLIVNRSIADVFSLLVAAGCFALFLVSLGALWSSLRSPAQAPGHPAEPWAY